MIVVINKERYVDESVIILIFLLTFEFVNNNIDTISFVNFVIIRIV